MSSGQFADAMHENRQLATFFFSPYFSVIEKKEGLERAVQDADPAFTNFLQALIERHRMPAIFRIRTDFETLWDEERKLLPVTITSAVTLDSDDRQATSATGSASRTTARSRSPADVDPDILGGVVLRVGNVILDASIRNRLEQLRKQVAQA